MFKGLKEKIFDVGIKVDQLLKIDFITNLTERAFFFENIANIFNKWFFGLSTCRCQEPQDSIDHI